MGAVTGLLAALTTATTGAAPVLRQQADQNGDVVLIGQTLAQDCRASVVMPLLGTVGPCGDDVGDGSPDAYWRADAPALGAATADDTITPALARSTAVLSLPAGATVTYARLYWAAKVDQAVADATVRLARPGVFDEAVMADDTWVSTTNGNFFQATADVTALVAAFGVGPYRVAEVEGVDLLDRDDNVAFSGWSLVVFYVAPNAPPRNLTLFDGFDRVSDTNPQAFSLSGFLVPNAFDATLGVVTYEGDAGVVGDELRLGLAPLDATDRLSDALNPVDNFFNSTRSTLGVATSSVGDLPQLTGGPDSMSSFDVDVVDITPRLTPGQTTLDVEASSTGDVYWLGPIVTSIQTFRPNFTTSTKSAFDLDGPPLAVGDALRYTIVVTNDGNDSAVDVTVEDPLPAGVSYVPGSLTIDASPISDAVDGDAGEVVGGVVTARVGAGADGTMGGQLDVGQTATVGFVVTVDAPGPVENQATVTASGLSGAPAATTPTDGDVGVPGPQTTRVDVLPGGGGGGGGTGGDGAGGIGGAGGGTTATGGTDVSGSGGAVVSGGTGGAGGTTTPGDDDGERLEGSGFRCAVKPATGREPQSGGWPPWGLLLSWVVLARGRRRRRRS
ncbi:MAG: DUF11 domain-containing protein [Myxococcota bacterium]